MLFPRLRTPIVLVHGLFGFGEVRVGGVTVSEYFPWDHRPAARPPAIARWFRISVQQAASLIARDSSSNNSSDGQSPQEPVHVLAHSMGGLDSRFMISSLGMAQRVLTLTTLGTPHRGSSTLLIGA